MNLRDYIDRVREVRKWLEALPEVEHGAREALRLLLVSLEDRLHEYLPSERHIIFDQLLAVYCHCLLYTSPSPRDS